MLHTQATHPSIEQPGWRILEDLPAGQAELVGSQLEQTTGCRSLTFDVARGEGGGPEARGSISSAGTPQGSCGSHFIWHPWKGTDASSSSTHPRSSMHHVHALQYPSSLPQSDQLVSKFPGLHTHLCDGICCQRQRYVIVIAAPLGVEDVHSRDEGALAGGHALLSAGQDVVVSRSHDLP